MDVEQKKTTVVLLNRLYSSANFVVSINGIIRGYWDGSLAPVTLSDSDAIERVQHKFRQAKAEYMLLNESYTDYMAGLIQTGEAGV